MHIRERIVIHASPEKIWAVLSDIQRLPEWNKKAHSVRSTDLQSGVGLRWRVDYRMKKKQSIYDLTVARQSPPHHLHLEIKEASVMGADRKPVEVTEIFELVPQGENTLVKHEVTVREDNIPWFFRPLVWLVMRFGKPVGGGPLEHLKKIVED